MFSALIGSVSILVSMYVLLPKLGLPKLDFAAVTGGWVGATGPYARLIGLTVFLLGGIAWAFLYARFWPWHNIMGGLAFGLIPFAASLMTVLPELSKVHIMLYPMPGFLWIKLGGREAVAANLVQHLIFGLCLAKFYR
ncbi:MAG: hypothetical protein ACOY94_16520 [Bacillota bacterium]